MLTREIVWMAGALGGPLRWNQRKVAALNGEEIVVPTDRSAAHQTTDTFTETVPELVPELVTMPATDIHPEFERTVARVKYTAETRERPRWRYDAEARETLASIVGTLLGACQKLEPRWTVVAFYFAPQTGAVNYTVRREIDGITDERSVDTTDATVLEVAVAEAQVLAAVLRKAHRYAIAPRPLFVPEIPREVDADFDIQTEDGDGPE